MQFTGATGVRHGPQPNAKPIEYLNLFLTDIVKETNMYANEFIENNSLHLEVHPHSRIHRYWIRKGSAFLGLLLGMGLVTKRTLESCN